MHCAGMHLTSCYAELELAWQKDVLEIPSVLSGAGQPSSPQRLNAFSPFSVLAACVRSSQRKDQHGAAREVHLSRRRQSGDGRLPATGPPITALLSRSFPQQIHLCVQSRWPGSLPTGARCRQHTQGRAPGWDLPSLPKAQPFVPPPTLPLNMLCPVTHEAAGCSGLPVLGFVTFPIASSV